jgi:hypothetical protein
MLYAAGASLFKISLLENSQDVKLPPTAIPKYHRNPIGQMILEKSAAQ